MKRSVIGLFGRTPQALVGNVMPLSIIASFSFFQSLVLPSVQAREENSRVTDTVMKLVCICTQAAIKIADVL